MLMNPVVELLPNRWTWWRIANSAWADPLDPGFAQAHGGRWNPPDSYPALYLNEDRTTARLNLRQFIKRWSYEPEDLRSDNGPMLIGAILPRNQRVCDAHTPKGIRSLGLPRTYPYDSDGNLIPHDPCQRAGKLIKRQELRGVRARSAQSRDGAGRELAWFPATSRSRAKRTRTLSFDEWYWN